MNHPPHATHCQDCGASYVHIEHPLKPGVVMMSVCKCEHTNPMQVMKANAPQWLQDWTNQVLTNIEVEGYPWCDESDGVHYIVKEMGDTFEVHLWPAPFLDPEGEGMTVGELHAHLLPIVALFDGGRPESMCFEAGAVAATGKVKGNKVVLLILDMPPDVYDGEDEDDEEEVPN